MNKKLLIFLIILGVVVVILSVIYFIWYSNCISDIRKVKTSRVCNMYDEIIDAKYNKLTNLTEIKIKMYQRWPAYPEINQCDKLKVLYNKLFPPKPIKLTAQVLLLINGLDSGFKSPDLEANQEYTFLISSDKLKVGDTVNAAPVLKDGTVCGEGLSRTIV